MGKLKQIFINYLTKHLIKAVSEDDILRITNRDWFYHRRKLSHEEISTLKDEAKLLNDSVLWNLMIKEIEYIAFLTMTSKAQTTNDIIFGKALFYALDNMKKFLGRLKDL